VQERGRRSTEQEPDGRIRFLVLSGARRIVKEKACFLVPGLPKNRAWGEAKPLPLTGAGEWVILPVPSGVPGKHGGWFNHRVRVVVPPGAAKRPCLSRMCLDPSYGAETVSSEPHQVSLGFTRQDFPAGVHVCQIFSKDEERLDAVLKFLCSGLEAGERVACFTDDLDDARLGSYLPSIPSHLPSTPPAGLSRKRAPARFTSQTAASTPIDC
jgi:hypothetical protein